jgi:hypothetical protein
MTHLLALCFEIVPAGFVGAGDTGNALGDHHARGFQSTHFVGIIREQADRIHSQMPQDGAWQMVTSQVALEAKLLVGLDGIGAVILELIGTDLVHESDAPAFLQFIDDQAAPFAGYFFQSDLELSAAIAAQAVKDVAGEALGMNSHKRSWPLMPDVSHDECDRFFKTGAAIGHVEAALEAVDAERPVFGGEIGFSCLSEFELTGGMNNFIIMNTQTWNSI